MSWLHAISHRVAVLLRGKAYAREVQEEMRFHLELEAMHQREDGLSEIDAARAARRRFGNRTYVAESVRQAGGWSLLDTALQDARIALRALRRAPAFAAVAILTLAFGIGANATVYSWLDGLVLHPFPAVRDPGGLVSIVTLTPRVPPPGESDGVGANHVTPDYFAAMGIPLLRGRAFRDSDRSDSSMVVIVNEAFVRQFFPRREALGAALNVGMSPKPNATIVGVVKDGIYDTNRMRDPTPPFMYIPYAQASPRGVSLHVRTASDPKALVPAVRRAVAEVAPGLPVLTPVTLDERVRTAFFLQRIGSTVLSALGGVALLLAALGLYGVVAYAVAQRAREVGIRVALGARRGQVISVFLQYGLKLTFLGVALGIVGALWAGRLLTTQLYGVNAGDPATLGGVAVLLTVIAVLATWIPARRAARVDPIVAMRSD